MFKGTEEKIDSEKSSVVGIPAAMSYALARNVNAMRSFVELSDEKRMRVIDGARQIGTVREMKRYVADICHNEKTR